MIICLEKYFCNQIISRNSLPVGREKEEEGGKGYFADTDIQWSEESSSGNVPGRHGENI